MAVISSLPSTSRTATLSHVTWWLEDPDDHAADIRLQVTSPDFTLSTPLQQGVFVPKGADRKVVVSREVLGKEGTMEFALISLAALDAWEELLSRVGSTLFLRSPITNRQWWVQIVGTPTQQVNLLDPADPFWTISAAVIEVAEP